MPEIDLELSTRERDVAFVVARALALSTLALDVAEEAGRLHDLLEQLLTEQEEAA